MSGRPLLQPGWSWFWNVLNGPQYGWCGKSDSYCSIAKGCQAGCWSTTSTVATKAASVPTKTEVLSQATQGSTLPGDYVCVLERDVCRVGQDSPGCSGFQLKYCLFDRWVVQSCASGTICNISQRKGAHCNHIEPEDLNSVRCGLKLTMSDGKTSPLVKWQA